jgi:subtilase family serine protease
MRRALLLIAFATAASLAAAQDQSNQDRSNVVIPLSSIERPGDIGTRAHTHYFMSAPDPNITPDTPPPGVTVETPGSIGCIYDLVSPHVSGCPVATATAVPKGGSDLIVIVDAFDYPSPGADLSKFDAKWGLAGTTLVKKYANGHKPPNACDNGWEGEESLDIEWAHAMAPKATIVLMEAASDSLYDLTQAVHAANVYIKNHGGKGEVSMSWGSSEFGDETTGGTLFNEANVVYFASAGDSAGVNWPSTSPDVVSTGGTQIERNSAGHYTGQVGTKNCGSTAGVGCGGGQSHYESRPSYQNGVSSVVGHVRGIPDIASDSSMDSPVWVYNSSCFNSWVRVWGTSVASPTLAGVINNAGSFKSSSKAELTEIYNNRHVTADYTDIKSGSCVDHSAHSGYDLCTGVGVVKGFAKK